MHNGYFQYVTRNLEPALRHLRCPNEKLYLWIDALCINQNSVEERSQQVQLMANIYSRASRVLVWLGEASNDSDSAIKTSEKWTLEYCFDEDSPMHLDLISELLEDRFDQETWSAVQSLVKRPYWTRTWVFQEIMLGHDVQVKCGYKDMPWKCIEGLLEIAYQVERKEETLKLRLREHRWTIIKDTLETINRLAVFTNFPDATEQQAQIFSLLRWTTALSCGDPRDRIYGILQLTKDSDSYPSPDYSASVAKVYTDFARREIVRSQRLDILHEAACRPAPDLRYDTEDVVPSWVPKWTLKQQNRMPYTAGTPLYDAAAGRLTIPLDSTTSHLGLKGLKVDTTSWIASASVMDLGLPECLAFIENVNHMATWSDYCGLGGYTHLYPTKESLLFVLFRTLLLDMDFRFATRLDVGKYATLMLQTAEGFLLRLGYDCASWFVRISHSKKWPI